MSKDEEEVAKYLRFNLESKKSSLLGDEAYYFFGSKAVDFLMDSKWAATSKSTVTFTHRESVCVFLNRLLNLRYFDHVHVIKTEKKVKKKDGDKKKEETDKKEEPEKKKEVEKKKSEKSKTEEKEKDEKKVPGSPRSKKDKEKDGKEMKKVRKKVKINLEPHEDQLFHDSEDEAYVWIYDPVSWKTFFFGILLVLAIIAVCLFPLWPENVREYSWYLSVAGAIFVGSILVLAVLRYIFYGIIWVCTMGKLHFWLLPNLTAECGFFESFVPFYEYSVTKSQDAEAEKKGKKGKREGDSDKENASDVNNDKDDDDNAGEDDVTNTSQDVSSLNIDNDFENISKEDEDEEEACNGTLDSDNENEQCGGIEEIADDDEIPEKCSGGEDIEQDVSCFGAAEEQCDDEKDVDSLMYDEKLENESEESNGSTKEEGWVKVKKVDVAEELLCNENEVNC